MTRPLTSVGPIPLLGEAVTMLFIGQAIGRERQPPPGQHGHQTLLSERTDEAIACHRGDLAEHGAPLPTAAARGGQQRVAGDLRRQLARAPDDVGEDRQHRATPRALETPDREAAETDPHRVRMTRQASSPSTGRLMFEVAAAGEAEGEHTCNTCLAVCQQAAGRGFISKIDGAGAVFSRRFGRCAHGAPLGPQVWCHLIRDTMGVTH